jgi:hypothetical protein
MRHMERFFLIIAVLALFGALFTAELTPARAAPDSYCNFNNRSQCPFCVNLSPTTYCATGNNPNGQIIWCDTTVGPPCVIGGVCNCIGTEYTGQCGGGGVATGNGCNWNINSC